MNRRKFLKFLGLGLPAVALAPKALLQPEPVVSYAMETGATRLDPGATVQLRGDENWLADDHMDAVRYGLGPGLRALPEQRYANQVGKAFAQEFDRVILELANQKRSRLKV